MSPIGYVPGCIRVIVGGAIHNLPAETLCMPTQQYIVGASFESDGVYTYGDNASSDYGPNEIKNRTPCSAMSIVGCMGREAYVLLPNSTSKRGVRCRVESAGEALARADNAITMLEAALELAKVKCQLATRGAP